MLHAVRLGLHPNLEVCHPFGVRQDETLALSPPDPERVKYTRTHSERSCSSGYVTALGNNKRNLHRISPPRRDITLSGLLMQSLIVRLGLAPQPSKYVTPSG